MIDFKSLRPRLALLCLSLLLLTGPVSAQSAVANSAVEVPAVSRLADLSQLATRGQFDDILQTLKQNSADDASVTSLIAALERYQQQKIDQTRLREEGFAKAYARMQELHARHATDEAIISAIEAHGLAADPTAFLADPKLMEVVAHADAAVATAQEKHEWLEVVSLYRMLDMLYDTDGRYHEQLADSSQHLQALRLYTPQLLEDMIRERNARKAVQAKAEQADGIDAEADGELPPVRVDKTSWSEQLEGVQLAMLRQTLNHARRKHITEPDYKSMLTGAIESVKIVSRTKALGTTFAKLNDDATVKQFTDQLDRLETEVNGQGNNIDFLDAARLVDRILAINHQTIELPDHMLIYEMTSGVTATLDDFSAVIWPRDLESFKRSFNGAFYGVGVQISLRDNRLIVVSPLMNTPAQRAGLKAQDIIATVDGQDTTGWSLDKAVRQITGPENTEVSLGIERVGEKEPLIFKLKRAEIPIESVRGWRLRADGTWDHYIDRDDRIGYVRISQFLPQTAEDIDLAVEHMSKDAGLAGLIIDLRFNPGGLLGSSVSVVDRFINAGTIVSTVGPDGKETGMPLVATDGHTYDRFPVVVLINQGSASASEIVSGALQDYERALIVGTRSYGKGSVQEVFPLDGYKAYLKLTTQYYRLPSGRIIHRKPKAKTWGIEPDIEVTMTTEQVADALVMRQAADVLVDLDAPADGKPPVNPDDLITKGVDTQLTTALLILRTQAVAEHLAANHRQAAK